MRFRPCIDIHNGYVKQIVGGTIDDAADRASENFVSDRDGAYYSNLYYERKLSGGHVILLNGRDSPFYEKTKEAAVAALREHAGFMQVGGGITPDNASFFLDAGASHVIVTSYVFTSGRIDFDRLNIMRTAVGKSRLVLDLSCRKLDDDYYVVTDRWQKYTMEKLSESLLDRLSEFADEYLIHSADVEGKASGPSDEVLGILSDYEGIPVTYAGGIASLSDIQKIKESGHSRVDVTVGSALDIFGGELPLEDVLKEIER